MRNAVPCLRSRLLVRVAAIALVSGATAACSSDSNRFGESPFSNPFQSSSAEPAPRQDTTYSTGSIQAAPTTRVQRAPLGAPSAVQQRPMYGYGGSQSGGSSGGYQSSRLDPQSTGSVQPRPASSGSSNWSAANGTTVTLGRGDSIHTISQRYGVPASAIMQANGLTNANGVGEGRQLVIPSYSAGGGYSRTASASSTLRPVAPTMQAAPMQQPTTMRPLPARPQLAAAAPVAPVAGPVAKPKMQLVQGAQPKGVEPVKPVKTAAAPALKPSVEAQPTERAYAAAPAKPSTPDDNVKTAALKVDPAPAAADSGPSFRWPVRGRVISGYGSKSSGSSNDGINLAVPEGTEVKASDDGVVAYSGSELKGFGNLVLIRHSNGWVTAYAHNSALNVKRGDTVRRGQIIAKSGSTGSVSSPQLHFEVRKGASTVDPLKHLPDV